jgi:hypothetical protein
MLDRTRRIQFDEPGLSLNPSFRVFCGVSSNSCLRIPILGSNMDRGRRSLAPVHGVSARADTVRGSIRALIHEEKSVTGAHDPRSGDKGVQQ